MRVPELEAQVGMLLLGRDVSEVRAALRGRQVVADQPPTGPKPLGGLGHRPTNDGPQLVDDLDDRRRE